MIENRKKIRQFKQKSPTAGDAADFTKKNPKCLLNKIFLLFYFLRNFLETLMRAHILEN